LKPFSRTRNGVPPEFFYRKFFLKKLITDKKNENNRTGKRSGADEPHVHLPWVVREADERMGMGETRDRYCGADRADTV
jgi:hypothetical protein